jgi:phospholipase C
MRRFMLASAPATAKVRHRTAIRLFCRLGLPAQSLSMRRDNRSKALRCRLLSCVALGAMTVNVLAPVAAAQASGPNTRTPIKHLIVVIGENRSFDNVFATYVPADPRQSVWNLLSQGIVD